MSEHPSPFLDDRVSDTLCAVAHEASAAPWLVPPETLRFGRARPRAYRSPRVLVTVLVLVGVGVGIAVTSRQPATRPRPTAAPASTTAPTTSETRLDQIAFSSPMTGYGLFEMQPQHGGMCEDLVGHTTDGGVRFGTLMSVDIHKCESNAPVDSLSFDDHGDGFAYGPTLFVTHDGGLIWTRSAQPGSVLSVQAIGHSVWMVEADCPVAVKGVSSSCSLELLESSDGGHSWKAARTQPPGASVPGNGSKVAEEPALGQTWLVRTSATSAYVLSYPAYDSAATAPGVDAPLWYTANGGASWSVRQIPCGIAALSVVMAVGPQGTLFAMCAGQPSAGFQQKSAARSTDSGAQWTSNVACITHPSAILTASGCVSEPLDDTGYLGGISAVSEKTAFIVGGRSALHVTHDAGRLWSTVQPSIGGTTWGTTQVVFFNASDGAVVGKNAADHGASTLWTTRDSGAHWTAHVPRTGVVEAVQADVILGADGLGVVKVGAAQADAVATVRRYLGPPAATTTHAVCPGRTDVEWNDLSLEFTHGDLAGYRYFRGGSPTCGGSNPPGISVRRTAGRSTCPAYSRTINRVSKSSPALPPPRFRRSRVATPAATSDRAVTP